MSGRDDFFVGWAGQLPRADAARFVIRVGLGCAVLLLVGLLLGRGQDDPGAAGFDPAGEVTRRGVLTLLPYPTLWSAPDASHPAGHAMLLAGEGKRGAPVAPAWEGRTVDAVGVIFRRGTLDMLQIDSLTLVDAGAARMPVQAEGRWRIEGEICDGKCQAGAMRPGRGIAHRACAILCLNGDIPPVFVPTGPVAGQEFLLLGNADGGPGDTAWRSLVGLRVRLDGRLERRGDMLVFLAELDKAAVVP